MASRPILTPFSVITNGDMSGEIISAVTVIQNISGISYDISWSGTGCLGDFAVQVSNTFKENPAGGASIPGNWQDLPIGADAIVDQDSGNGFINCVALANYAIRLVYTPTAGTGTLNAKICGKVS